MSDVLLSIPLVLVLLTLIFLGIRTVARLWFDHRLKMVLLERLERRPDIIDAFPEIKNAMDSSSTEHDSGRQDLILSGALLALIGIVLAIVFNLMGNTGQWAVGGYFGGVFCVAFGFILALFGLLVRFLTRAPLR